MGTREAGRVSGRGFRGAKEGVTAKLPNLDLADYESPVSRSVGGNLLFGSLPAMRTAEASEGVVAPLEAEAGVGHSRTRSGFRCGGGA